MKSGKSLELINTFAPLKNTNTRFVLFQPSKNTRNEKIWSRSGAALEAEKIDSLFEILDRDLDIIGIDEVNMFEQEDAEAIKKILEKGTKVIAAGLDMDYKGKMFPIAQRLLELGPENIKYKKAVCEICKSPDAIYSQIYKGSNPVLRGLPSVLPDDGTYVYKPVCGDCFIKEKF